MFLLNSSRLLLLCGLLSSYLSGFSGKPLAGRAWGVPPGLGEASAPISCSQLTTPPAVVTRRRWGLAAPGGFSLNELPVCWGLRPNFTPVFRGPWNSVFFHTEGSEAGITRFWGGWARQWPLATEDKWGWSP